MNNRYIVQFTEASMETYLGITKTNTIMPVGGPNMAVVMSKEISRNVANALRQAGFACKPIKAPAA